MFIVAVDMALSGWPLFVVEVFPGHWQLNACSTPKRVNSRPCERNQTKLESTYRRFLSGAQSDSVGRVGKSVSISEAEAWRSPVSRAQDGSERVVHFRLEGVTQRRNPERTTEVKRKLYARGQAAK